MTNFDEMLDYKELLFGVAIDLTKNIDEAEDLVQNTYLSTLKAVKSGKNIDNLKAYLMKVLKNDYYKLFNKQKKESVVEYSEAYDSVIEFDIDDFEDSDVKKTIEAHTIRRELAHLAKSYRGVMVAYYMKKMSVEDITIMLDLSEHIVRKRLQKGREIVKGEFSNMDSYYQSSYEPEFLTIRFSGRVGKNGEPDKVITNLIDHNVLIIAAKEPITPMAISKKMGISTAYVEESVEKLLKHEFLKKTGKNVYTDFIIIDEDFLKKRKEISKEYVDYCFYHVNEIFLELVDEYKKVGFLSAFNKEQMYIYAALSLSYNARKHISDKLDLLQFDDFPDRLDGGKWIIDVGYKYTDKNTSLVDFNTFGPWIRDYLECLLVDEWNTPLGETYSAKFSIDITHKERIQLLHALSKNKDIDPAYLPLIQEFEKYGFISNVKGKWKGCLPIISKKDYLTLQEINKKAYIKAIPFTEKKLFEILKTNKYHAPDWIDKRQPYLVMCSLSTVPLIHFERANEEKIINLQKDKKYPVSLFVEY